MKEYPYIMLYSPVPRNGRSCVPAEKEIWVISQVVELCSIEKSN